MRSSSAIILGRSLDISIAFAVAEVDGVVRLHFDEPDPGVEVLAAGGEQVAVDIGHQEQGGAGVEAKAVHFADVGPPADGGVLF